jgi:putative transposase
MRADVSLDAFVVMPNHFHAIIALGAVRIGLEPMSRAHAVRPYRGATLGMVVAGFKSACTRRYWATLHEGTAVLWQRGYYEHVIRGSDQLQRARRYITENPVRDEPGLSSPSD